MMNAIQKAISDVKRAIPIELLDITFNEYSMFDDKLISLDEKILTKVIRPRVLMDCNLVGGIETRIDLGKCSNTMLHNGEYMIEVPKALTNGKSIISPLSLVSNVMFNVGYNINTSQPTLAAAYNMAGNLSGESIAQTSKLELIGDNTILVQDPSIHITNGTLRCMIENDVNLSNINPRSYLSFAQLCIHAVKAHVYNVCIVKMGRGYIYGGHDLGIIKELVDSYSESNNEYLEYLDTTWSVVAFYNDSDSMSRLIVSMMGNNI